MPRLPAVPGLTKQEARGLEALAYLEPGGWQSLSRLGLVGRVKDADLNGLHRRGLVERRKAAAVYGEGQGTGGHLLWQLTPAGWALARANGWPAWADEQDDQDQHNADEVRAS